MKYTLGLDLGIASVGWAVINLDMLRIEDLGVRAFPAAENPKNQSPLAEPRRLARSARRRLRRRAGRLRSIRQLYVRVGLVSDAEMSALFIAISGTPSPWELRAKGLDELLTGPELARALYHIANRRGFKSSRRLADKDTEAGRVLGAIEATRAAMTQGAYRTAGEMLYGDPRFQPEAEGNGTRDLHQPCRRNSKDSYVNSVDRDTLENEVGILLARQRLLGSSHATTQFEAEFLELFTRQRPFATGDAILAKVGKCTFEPTQLRAPRNAYTTERFNLLCDINNKLGWFDAGQKVRATDEQRRVIEELAYNDCDVTYAKVRKALALPDTARFTALTYRDKTGNDSTACEKTGRFCQLKGYKAIRDMAKTVGLWDEVATHPEWMDSLAFALTFYKNEGEIRQCLAEECVPRCLADEAANSPGFAGVSHLSLAAMRKVIPHLERGLVYSDACAAAGYDHSASATGAKFQKLPVEGLSEIRNPVVLRALSQARKVVNAVIDRYGSPCQIHIELAREVGKSAEKRGEIERSIKDNELANKQRDALFAEAFGQAPHNYDERLKWRLYREQQCKCAYSLRDIDINSLLLPGYLQIDHIVPYSRSFDDSIANKVLVLCSENQRKGSKTPFEYFGSDDARWSLFVAWAKDTVRDHKKLDKLISQTPFDLEKQDWIPRNLVDTQYVARFLTSYIRGNLRFSDENVKLPMVCVSGRITSLMRGFWGLSKVREDNDLHHAMDAVVVAAIDQRTIGLVTRYCQARETWRWKAGDTYVDQETGEVVDFKYSFPLPWKGFRDEVNARLSDDPASAIAAIRLPAYSDGLAVNPVIISRMPQRGVTGPIHKETIKSARIKLPGGTVVRPSKIGPEEAARGTREAVIRKHLVDISAKDLENLFAPETNEKLYAEIRRRMEDCGMDAKKAFTEPLRKPTNDGSLGQIVRRVKLREPQPSGVEVRGGIANGDSMVRVDVFTRGGKYFLVPIYVSNFICGTLPNQAIVAHKPEGLWPLMDESYRFLFSIQSYDLIQIHRKGQIIFGYYRECDRAGGQISLSLANNNDTIVRGIGARTVDRFEKFEMGVLGDYHKVGDEVRRGVENSSNIKSGETEG